MRLRRFWIAFVPGDQRVFAAGVGLGCGVTAFDVPDALAIVALDVFGGAAVPEVARVVEDVDVSTLDAGHVLPNMSPPNARGVWFPAAYSRSIR